MAFAAFMARLLDAQTVAITMNLAGTFAPNEELYAMSERAAELNARIVERTKAEGGLRADVVDRRPVADPRAGVVDPARRCGRGLASSAAATWRCSSTGCALPVAIR